MKKKDFKLGAEARDAIIRVARHTRDIVGKTLGPAGRNYLLPSGITNDGKTILREIRFEDENEDNVAIVFMDVAQKTDDEVGDATTTSTVVATELAIDVVSKVQDTDVPTPGSKTPMQLKRELEEESLKAVELLKGEVREISSLEDLQKVAQTAMEDVEVANIVADTVHTVGKDSITLVKDGFSGKVERHILPGIQLPLKLAAPFLYNTDRKEAEHEKVPVLVANHVFESYSELKPFMSSYIKQENVPGRVAIVAKQFSIPFIGEVANVVRASQNKFQILLLVADLDADGWDDLAAFVDARLIDTHPRIGFSIAKAEYKDAGFAEKIVAGNKHTAIIGGRGLVTKAMTVESNVVTRVQERIEAIRSQIPNESLATKRKEMESRIAQLSGGIATIYVDADTAVERHYLKLKIEDAINACKAALDGGVVKGGGWTLLGIANQLGENSLLYKALRAPYDCIQTNNGADLEIGDDVIDSFLSVKAAIVNSVSAVKILITTEGLIADHVPDAAGELLKKFTGEE